MRLVAVHRCRWATQAMNESANENEVLAIDVGGTHLRAALITEDGTILARADRPTAGASSSAAVAELANTLASGRRCARCVAGLPGRVNYRRGLLEYAPNLPPSWSAELTEAGLSDALGLPVAIANDADLAAVGEAFFGAGRDAADMVYVTVSTGVGAGVILGGRLVRGDRSIAEVGHTVIDRVALAAGLPATVEDLGSGTAMAREALTSGLVGDGADLVALVRRGDPDAARIWTDAIHAAALGVANTAFLFAPEVIVLGGGVSRTGALLLEPVRSYLHLYGPPGLADTIDVRVAELGDDAGLVGAAAWSRATGGQ